MRPEVQAKGLQPALRVTISLTPAAASTTRSSSRASAQRIRRTHRGRRPAHFNRGAFDCRQLGRSCENAASKALLEAD